MTVKEYTPAFRPENIPAELKALKRWAPWRARVNKATGKVDKVPLISTAKPDEWLTFDEAEAWRAREGLPGAGIVTTGHDDLLMLDIDKCLDDRGRPNALAQAAMDAFPGYWEATPSGSGLRGASWGRLAGGDFLNHDIGLEAYCGSAARFLTMTGDEYVLSDREVRQALPAALEWLEGQRPAKRVKVPEVPMPELLAEADLPLLDDLNLEPVAYRFLAEGDEGEDGSKTLFQAAIGLYKCGLDDAQVLSILFMNDHALALAHRHRRENDDKALDYLWRHHCLPARAKASRPVTPEDFEDLGPGDPDEDEIRRLARLTKKEYDRERKKAAEQMGIRTSVLDDEVKAARKRMSGKARPAGFMLGEDDRVINNMTNNLTACRDPKLIGMELAFDAFRDEIVRRDPEGGEWRAFGDCDYAEIRERLDGLDFSSTSIELVRSAVSKVAEERKMDSAIEWLDGLRWDGVPRIAGFMHAYFGCADDDYSRAVSLYTWTALAGRILEPGCQADMAPVWISPEGRLKSSMAAAMAPCREMYTEIALSDKDTDLSRKMRGCAIAEMSDLAGMKSRESEHTKQLITRRYENWTPKFKEFNTRFPRRLIFIGTTNEDRFLVSQTGNRRFLPIHIGKGDIAALRRDHTQLWAEAAAVFTAEGVVWAEAEALGRARHTDHMVLDDWQEVLEQWLDAPQEAFDNLETDVPHLLNSDVPELTNRFILEKCFQVKPDQWRWHMGHRVTKLMENLGFEQKKTRFGKKTMMVWKRVPQ